MTEKSTVAEIRTRFDADVERFSNLETGQSATIDAPLGLELISRAAVAVTPHARTLLDVGCGAGNYTLKCLPLFSQLEAVTLIDLSTPMLDRAVARIAAVSSVRCTPIAQDIRDLALTAESFDVILAAAVLHHLRTDAEWEATFAKFRKALRPGGSLWIFDLLEADHPGIRALEQSRYGDYLTAFRGPQYRDDVFAYIAREDTPRSLTYQCELLRRVGFAGVEVLHKNGCFAAFGGWIPS